MTGRDFEAFADLLTYPAAAAADLRLPQVPEGAAGELGRFAAGIAPMGRGELEELYTRTFDINPVASLEVGWHLYGEQYERGAFLVKMRELLRAHGVAESAELPDHLTHLLRLPGVMEPEEARELAERCLLPAVTKMLAGFAGTDNPYAHLMAALKQTLEQACMREVTHHV